MANQGRDEATKKGVGELVSQIRNDQTHGKIHWTDVSEFKYEKIPNQGNPFYRVYGRKAGETEWQDITSRGAVVKTAQSMGLDYRIPENGGVSKAYLTYMGDNYPPDEAEKQKIEDRRKKAEEKKNQTNNSSDSSVPPAESEKSNNGMEIQNDDMGPIPAHGHDPDTPIVLLSLITDSEIWTVDTTECLQDFTMERYSVVTDGNECKGTFTLLDPLAYEIESRLASSGTPDLIVQFGFKDNMSREFTCQITNYDIQFAQDGMILSFEYVMGSKAYLNEKLSKTLRGQYEANRVSDVIKQIAEESDTYILDACDETADISDKFKQEPKIFYANNEEPFIFINRILEYATDPKGENRVYLVSQPTEGEPDKDNPERRFHFAAKFIENSKVDSKNKSRTVEYTEFNKAYGSDIIKHKENKKPEADADKGKNNGEGKADNTKPAPKEEKQGAVAKTQQTIPNKPAPIHSPLTDFERQLEAQKGVSNTLIGQAYMQGQNGTGFFDEYKQTKKMVGSSNGLENGFVPKPTGTNSKFGKMSDMSAEDAYKKFTEPASVKDDKGKDKKPNDKDPETDATENAEEYDREYFYMMHAKNEDVIEFSVDYGGTLISYMTGGALTISGTNTDTGEEEEHKKEENDKAGNAKTVALPVTIGSDLRTKAEALYNRLREGFVRQGNLTLRGDPTLVVNRSIKVTVVVNQNIHHSTDIYKIVKVTHNISSGSFTTALELLNPEAERRRKEGNGDSSATGEDNGVRYKAVSFPLSLMDKYTSDRASVVYYVCDKLNGIPFAGSGDRKNWNDAEEVKDVTALDIKSKKLDQAGLLYYYLFYAWCNMPSNILSQLKGMKDNRLKGFFNILPPPEAKKVKAAELNKTIGDLVYIEYQKPNVAVGGIGANEKDIYQKLISLGYKPNLAAGIIGNMFQESSCVPNKVQGGALGFKIAKLTDGKGNKGYGLCQWTSSDRKKNLAKFAQAHCGEFKMTADAYVQTIDCQVRFFDTEFRKGYSSIMNKNLSASGFAEEVCLKFERPGKPHLSARKLKAEQIASKSLTDKWDDISGVGGGVGGTEVIGGIYLGDKYILCTDPAQKCHVALINDFDTVVKDVALLNDKWLTPQIAQIKKKIKNAFRFEYDENWLKNQLKERFPNHPYINLKKGDKGYNEKRMKVLYYALKVSENSDIFESKSPLGRYPVPVKGNMRETYNSNHYWAMCYALAGVPNFNKESKVHSSTNKSGEKWKEKDYFGIRLDLKNKASVFPLEVDDNPYFKRSKSKQPGDLIVTKDGSVVGIFIYETMKLLDTQYYALQKNQIIDVKTMHGRITCTPKGLD